jgi:CheY-like chemotaxis protein
MALNQRSSSSRQVPQPSVDQTPVRVAMRKTDRPMILVVDDDSDAREIYSEFLKSKGCDVYIAKDGAEAVKKAADLWPNVVVMDLAMPTMDGWEAIRRLHQSSWTSMIPVIAVSAVSEGRDAAFAVGCDAYLMKPCLPQVLWAQIQALLTPPDARPPYK